MQPAVHTSLHTLDGQSGSATLAAFSSDCISNVSGSNPGPIRQWSAVGGTFNYACTGFYNNILHRADRNMHYYMEDGWIYLASPRQRLCWIPIKSRGELASSGNRITLGTSDGRVVNSYP
jgi:hypothetical protein